jgi:hypothetical protein
VYILSLDVGVPSETSTSVNTHDITEWGSSTFFIGFENDRRKTKEVAWGSVWSLEREIPLLAVWVVLGE